MTQMTEEEVFQAFFAFFNWTYGVELSGQHINTIANEIRVGWSNTDTSEQELVAYVLQLHQLISDAPLNHIGKLRSNAKKIFKKEFGSLTQNDRSRVLMALHSAIEELRPGATRVRYTHVAPVQTTQQSPPVQPAQPPPSVQTMQPPPPVHATQPIPPAQPGPYVTSTQPTAYPQSPNVPAFDPFKIQQDAHREQQMRTLESNIEAMKHQTNMSIIGNIR